MIKTYETCWF